MTSNFNINKELLDAMRIIARQEIEKCNRDITKTARVINVNNDKTEVKPPYIRPFVDKLQHHQYWKNTKIHDRIRFIKIQYRYRESND